MVMHESMAMEIGKNVYVAGTAVIIGNVRLSDGVSVFDHAVIRGDLNEITIGPDSNVQDNVTIHVDAGNPVRIGRNVSIGHNAVVHGATVDDDVIIGMGAVVLNGSRIRSGSVVAAGAVVTENFESPENSIIAGVPARVRRTDPSIRDYPVRNGESYQNLRDLYLSGKFEKRVGDSDTYIY